MSLITKLQELAGRKSDLGRVCSYLSTHYARCAPTRSRFYQIFVIFVLLTVPSAAARANSSWVHGEYRPGDFKLVYAGRAADIVISPEDFKVVRIAAEALAADVERVTGKNPRIRREADGVSAPAIIVGTLGQSRLIDALVRAGRLDVNRLRNQWESFVIATVPHPLPGVPMGLAIVGSDRRGTAYGVFDLTQAIGVSPWYWWADVTPERRNNLIVRAGVRRAGPPSVQYRGIFLNDEDWGLQPWAAKTFEPERGDIGPKTYARICELLLRLKANTLWPAMHECTRAFNLIPENRQVADDYAIVMGSSHAEPMLRNNVGEWRGKPEDYDYTKNREGVRRYWEERVATNGKFENIYTLGMRGIHDSAMRGPKNTSERIKLLEQIFADQRTLLASHVNPEVSKVPQIFVPYKEVLADYRGGLKVPADVTIVWPDDNFGYIRYFPTADEQQRPGGFGVYYHLSYLGQPLSYTWLETTPPPLIWEEMSKAYEHGARKFWIANVGDIKPGEIGMEFFLQLAWDISRWRHDNLPDFLTEWARREFGTKYASRTSAVMNEYYRLGFGRKPEHLQWYLPNEPARPSDLTAIDYGDEVQTRLDDYDSLLARANQIYGELPADRQDAFYELVAYPVRAARLANQRFFLMEKSAQYLMQGRASARDWADRAQRAGTELLAETAYYNEQLAGGKWRHMMAMEPNKGQWLSMRSTPPTPPPGLDQMRVPTAAGLGVAIEGRLAPLRADERDVALPALDAYTRSTRFIDVFNTGRQTDRWSAKASRDWIRLSRWAGNLGGDTRIQVSIDWNKAPKGQNVAGTVEITGAGATRIVNVPVNNPKPPSSKAHSVFVESGGVVSLEAEHFTGKVDRPNARWQVIPGLGRTGDSVTVFPMEAPSIETDFAEKAPALEYRLFLLKPGKFTLTSFLVPTHPLLAGQGLRYAVSLDDQPPQIVTVDAALAVPSRAWSGRVLDATTKGSTTLVVATAGAHVLKIYMVDPGVVLDKLVLDTGGARPSYFGPPETRIVSEAPKARNVRAWAIGPGGSSRNPLRAEGAK